MKLTKIFGWVLLVFGLTIIIWTLYSSYNIFTGKSSVSEFFRIKEKVNQTPSYSEGKLPVSSEVLQQEIRKMIGEQLKEMLPANTLRKALNLAVWSMLAWILISGGAQIASLGIKLLKT